MNKPDKAQADDFGEDVDIPAYDPTLATQSASESEDATPEGSAAETMYERTGRVAPQVIPPRGAAASREKTPEQPAEPADLDATDTVVFERPAAEAAENQSGDSETQMPAKERSAAQKERAVDSAVDRNAPLASDAPTTARDHAPQGRGTDHTESARPATVSDEAAGTATTSQPRRRPPRTRPAPEPTMAMSREPVTGADYAAVASPADADYAAPTGAAPVPAAPYADPALATDAQEVGYDPARDHRRGTMDLGIFLLRIVVGAYLVMEGVKTFFQLGNSDGLAGLESDFAGYSSPWLLSVAQPSLQLLAGVFLLLGLLSPVAAAVGIAVSTLSALHQLDLSGTGLNVLAWPPEVVLSVLLMVAVIALQFTGPGKVSLDYNRSWAQRPLASSWLWVVVGVAAAVALWWFAAGVNPLA